VRDGGRLSDIVLKLEPGPTRDLIAQLLKDPSLAETIASLGEDRTRSTKYVETHLRASRVTGHELEGAEALASSLRDLPVAARVDRYILLSPDQVSFLYFQAGLDRVLGYMISRRENGQRPFTEKGALPEWLA